MKSKSCKALIALFAVAGFSAYAQQQQFPDPAQMVQHRVDFLTQKLGLSTEQQQQATTIFTNAATNAQSSHDQMKAARESLQAAVTKNDGAAIDQAANSMANLMAQLISTHAKAEAAFYQTLTPDQQAKYAQIREHGPEMFVMHGLRGDGPPPF